MSVLLYPKIKPGTCLEIEKKYLLMVFVIFAAEDLESTKLKWVNIEIWPKYSSWELQLKIERTSFVAFKQILV